MDPIRSIVDSLYTLKVYNKEEIKNLIRAIKTDKNNIRNIELELTEELRDRLMWNLDRKENEVYRWIYKILNLLVQKGNTMNQAVNTIQELLSSIDRMVLGWENIVNMYINLINQKINLLEQERLWIINIGPEVYSELVDLYEFDNHLLMFKEINKILEKIKNRCRRDERR